jgi:capsid protein
VKAVRAVKSNVKNRPVAGRRLAAMVADPPVRGRYMACGYRAVTVANREGRAATQGSGDYHLKTDRPALINQAREFMRDNALFQGIIERSVLNVVGTGFGLAARTVNASWNERAEKLWRQYWQDPEIRGLMSGPDCERMVAQEAMAIGDLGVILTDQAKIQIIEAERIAGSSVMDDGIEVDAYGRPIRYQVCDWNRNGVLVRKPAAYDPDFFLFIPRLSRPSQTRAVPPCQAAFAMLHRINDVCDSEALSWQLLSRMALAINRAGATTSAFVTSRTDDGKTSTSAEGDFARRIHELDYALIFHGEPGEEVKGIERNLPGANFPESVTMFLRLLGLPLGLPLELVLLDWSRTNYSSARAALEQAFVVFRSWQSLLMRRFHQPVYRWKVDQWIAAGDLPDRADKYAHEWIAPAFPMLDMLKEAQAWGARLDRGLCTHGQSIKAMDMDRPDWLTARKTEVQDAITAAKEISDANGGIEVDWRIFAGLLPKAPSAQGGEGAGDTGGEEPPMPSAPAKGAPARKRNPKT